MSDQRITRRGATTGALAASTVPASAQPADARAFMARAYEMKRRAEEAGDQPYGAVLVAEGRIIGESPSRVIVDKNIDAHAERSAIKNALANRADVRGATLYSTSIPCASCQRAAAQAGIARMIYSDALIDAGAPRG